MIGVVDIGNTRTKLAVFHPDGALVSEDSFQTSSGMLPRAARHFAGGLERAVVCSVVPSATPVWTSLLLNHVGLLHVAGHDSPWGFRLEVEQPEKVGVDRLAALEGALDISGAVLVVDAGTATKFDLLEGVAKRTFPGGAIAPGLVVSYEAMLSRAAQLGPVDLNVQSPVVGYNTETAVRSGVLNGFAAMVDGMAARILEERGLPSPCAVVATGGNSIYLKSRARLITHCRPRLVLEGLHALAKKI